MRSFWARHRRKLVFAGVVAAGAYALGRYARRRLLEVQGELFAADLARQNSVQRFAQNQVIAARSLRVLLPELADDIATRFNEWPALERLANLKQRQQQQQSVGASDCKEVECCEEKDTTAADAEWENVKVTCIARYYAAVLALCAVCCLEHVRMNIIGRLFFLDSLQHTPAGRSAQPHDSGFGIAGGGDAPEEEDEGKDCGILPSSRRFLPVRSEKMMMSFAFFFLREGWHVFGDAVLQATKTVYSGLSLHDDLSLETLVAKHYGMLRELETMLTCSALRNRGELMIPLQHDEQKVLRAGGILPLDDNDQPGNAVLGRAQDPLLRRMLDEMRDTVDAPVFEETLLSLLRLAFDASLPEIQAVMGLTETQTSSLGAFLKYEKHATKAILDPEGNTRVQHTLLASKPLEQLSSIVFTQLSDVCAE